jgi:hypothetical protein
MEMNIPFTVGAYGDATYPITALSERDMTGLASASQLYLVDMPDPLLEASAFCSLYCP